MFERERIPIGVDNFAYLRDSGMYYIDKTRFIQQIIDRIGVQVFLFPRPRRFGKTLAMTMLRAYFEKSPEDHSAWFKDLHIWQAGPQYREHFQKYPVIYITLKEVKEPNADAFLASIKTHLANLYRDHSALLSGSVLSPMERQRFESILYGTAPIEVLKVALSELSLYLHRAHGKPAIILIDEYDAAIHEAYLKGFAEPVLDFFRRFLGSALKGNPHLHKAVLTGILRISKESIFSDLNNVSVYSILHSDYSDAFGFTESEVSAVLEQAGLQDKTNEVRDWYNGYLFGGQVMYNPWSLLNYIATGGKAQGYWVNTSTNALIKEVLIQHAGNVGDELETLLSGGEIERNLEENTALGQLATNTDVLYSLLTFAGYLKPKAIPSFGHKRYALRIPNHEVREVYVNTFREWLRMGLGGNEGHVHKLCTALLKGEAKEAEKQMQRLALATFSYHDTALPDPEKFYHGFVLGLLTTLEPDYRVRSNRESGDGRPDVLVIPAEKGKPGVVMELKVADPDEQTLDQALDEGEAQMKAKQYDTELSAQGVSLVVKWVVAFDGKVVKVRRVV